MKGEYGLVAVTGEVNKKLCISLYYGMQMMQKDQEVDKQESSLVLEPERKNLVKLWMLKNCWNVLVRSVHLRKIK